MLKATYPSFTSSTFTEDNPEVNWFKNVWYHRYSTAGWELTEIIKASTINASLSGNMIVINKEPAGVSKYIGQNISLEAGKTYTISGYVIGKGSFIVTEKENVSQRYY
jgi:hypothetical protein